jgi:hypothetical protein
VQVLVVGFDGPAFSGRVLAEFARLREAGIVRLVDLLLVSRGDDGTFEVLDLPSELDAGYGAIATAIVGERERDGEPLAGESGAAVVWSMEDAVPPGTSAAIALIEHTWAGPLVAAINAAGGSTREETWLSPQDLEQLDGLLSERRTTAQQE